MIGAWVMVRLCNNGCWYCVVRCGFGYKKSAGDFLSPALRGRLPTLPLAQYHRRDQV